MWVHVLAFAKSGGERVVSAAHTLRTLQTTGMFTKPVPYLPALRSTGRGGGPPSPRSREGGGVVPPAVLLQCKRASAVHAAGRVQGVAVGEKRRVWPSGQLGGSGRNVRH